MAATVLPRTGPAGSEGPLGRRRARLRLGRRRLEADLDEAIAKEPLGVQERERAGARAQHDHHELLSPPPGRHGEVVPGLLGEPGLEGLHAPGVVEEWNVTRVDPAVVYERLAPEHAAGVRMVAEQAGRQLGEIAGRAPLAGVGQATGDGEVGAGEAELRGL